MTDKPEKEQRPLTLATLHELLNESQCEAVTYDGGHLLVIAGAGSGKTRVITYRIAWLLAKGVNPAQILAITFTNKAAREMRTRIEKMVPDPPRWMGTFHSTCARILRREAAALGRGEDFSIYDRDDSLRVMRQVLKDMGLAKDKDLKPSQALSLVGRAKNEMRAGDDLFSICRHPRIANLLAEAYRNYQARLLVNNAMDFDDLLLQTVLLFQNNPKVRKQYQQRWTHIFIDEYQDTNLPQDLIVKLLAGPHTHVTAVGDPDQMIYGWRGARIENILDFTKDFPGARMVKLEVNYRSTRKILKAASDVVARNKLRHPKVLIPDRGEGDPVVVFAASDPGDEALRVAEMIRDLMDEGYRAADVAVFYRTNLQSRSFEQEFTISNIPYAVLDSIAFFQRKEVKDLRAYLQVLVNPLDNESLVRIINTPTRGIGARTVEQLLAEANRRRVGLLAACGDAEARGVLSAGAQKKVEAFAEMMAALKTGTSGTIVNLIQEIVERTGYLKALSEQDLEKAQDVLGGFMAAAEHYDLAGSAEGSGLRDFLEHLALVSDNDRYDPDKNVVSLMTFHAAKGLEFPVVFITGVEEGILPHHRSIKDDSGAYDSVKIEEERRLFHVGMTRAEEKLIISWCEDRWMGGGSESNGPSGFLRELPAECLKVIGQGFGEGVADEEDDDDLFESIGRTTAPDADADLGEASRFGRRKRTPASEASAPVLNLAVGDIVEHRQMGRGVVVAIGAHGPMATADIEFEEGGRQKLILKHSGLVKISGA